MEEYLRSAKPVLRVWFSPRLPATARKEVQELCRAAGIDCRHAPDAKLAALTGTSEHGGVVARSNILLLNTMGARVRVAAGCATVLLPAKGGALPGQVFLEASAGYGTRLRIVRVPKLVPALERLKREGYWVYGLAARAPRGLFGHELAEKTVFVLGNESNGIRPTVQAALDESLSIPVAEGVDSLNVAVTTALCAFEAVRAGRTSSTEDPDPTGGRSAASRGRAKAGSPLPRG